MSFREIYTKQTEMFFQQKEKNNQKIGYKAPCNCKKNKRLNIRQNGKETKD